MPFLCKIIIKIFISLIKEFTMLIYNTSIERGNIIILKIKVLKGRCLPNIFRRLDPLKNFRLAPGIQNLKKSYVMHLYMEGNRDNLMWKKY